MSAQYGVLVPDDSMAPMAYKGQMIFVEPSLPLIPKRLVLIERSDGYWCIRRFIRYEADRIVVEMFLPARREITLAPQDIRSADCVVAVGDRWPEVAT